MTLNDGLQRPACARPLAPPVSQDDRRWGAASFKTLFSKNTFQFQEPTSAIPSDIWPSYISEFCLQIGGNREHIQYIELPFPWDYMGQGSPDATIVTQPKDYRRAILETDANGFPRLKKLTLNLS
jgi:hypothetical protein